MYTEVCNATGGWLSLLRSMNCTAPPEEVRAMFGLAHDAIERSASG
jgi:hypothetical protein